MADFESDGHDAFSMPLVTPFGQSNIASEMIGQDKNVKKLFLTLTYFLDEEEAADYADIIHKCEKHHMEAQKLRWIYRIAAKCSVKGYRSAQIVDILTQIQRIAEAARKERVDASRSENRGVKQNA